MDSVSSCAPFVRHFTSSPYAPSRVRALSGRVLPAHGYVKYLCLMLMFTSKPCAHYMWLRLLSKEKICEDGSPEPSGYFLVRSLLQTKIPIEALVSMEANRSSAGWCKLVSHEHIAASYFPAETYGHRDYVCSRENPPSPPPLPYQRRQGSAG